jgi:uncharacterized repeat protein (TIGR01451 family)
MKRKLLIGILSFLVLASAQAFADIPGETASGTDIAATGTMCSLNFTDSGHTTMPTVNVPTIDIIVASMYGWDFLANLPDWNYTTAGKPLTYMYIVTNEGNVTNGNYGAALNMSPGGATGFTGIGWSVAYTSDANASGGTPGNLTSAYPQNTAGWDSPQNYANGESRRIWITVTPSSLNSQSPDGSYLMITMEAGSGLGVSSGYGYYFGANSITYGGTRDATDITYTCIQTSVMNLSRSAIVDAPITANGKYTGGAHDAVPGAVITYTIMTSNDGSANALSNIIIDKVPANTWICHVGAYSGNQSTVPNVNITAAQPNAWGWTAYYTTSSSPNMTFGYIGTDWTTISAVPVDLHTRSDIKYVKWEKPTVTSTEDARTLTWGVTIR